MSVRTAMVVGGTGPTGPDIVNGLRDRGYRTAVFHSGRHEASLPDDVEHIHGDAHFPDTIAEALGDREFDVVITQYGRLRHLAEHFRHRTGHVVAIGGFMGPLAAIDDERWGPLGRPSVVREDARLTPTANAVRTLGSRMAEANRALLEHAAGGAYRATHIGYPLLYGPRQPGASEWSIVRRLRDGRRRIVLPDNGLRLESRAYTGNVALAPLLAVDHPELADGHSYVVTDRDLYTTRQRVEFIAAHLGVDVEIVDLPWELATPTHPFYRTGPEHRAGIAERIRSELGYHDRVATADALARTVEWLRRDDIDIAELEAQLGDPFDYAYEDRLLDWWDTARAEAPRAPTDFTYRHNYRHPTRGGSTESTS